MSDAGREYVLRCSPFGGATFIVHYALADVANDMNHNRLWMSVADLAKRARANRRSVQRAMRDLEDGGFIHLIREDAGRGRTYQFLFPEMPVVYETRSTAGGVKMSPVKSDTGDTTPPGGRHHAALTKEEPKLQTPPTPSAPPRAEVVEVFTAWQEATGHTGAKLDAKRRRFIEARLKDFDVVDLVAAVRGWRHSPHHRGENPTGQVYDGIAVLLRDAEQVEKFRDLELDAASRPVAHAAEVKPEERTARAQRRMMEENERRFQEERAAQAAVIPNPEAVARAKAALQPRKVPA